MTAEGLMTTPAITIRPEATIVQAARLLAQHRIKRLPWSTTRTVSSESSVAATCYKSSSVPTRRYGTRSGVRSSRGCCGRLGQVSVSYHGVVTPTGTLRQRSLIRSPYDWPRH